MVATPIQGDPVGGGGVLGTLDRAWSVIEDLLNVIAALTIFVVMLATTAQIFFRIAGHPVPGYLEASEQAIAVFAFLGAAYGQRLGAHIRMELVVGAAQGRLRWMMELFTTILALFVVGLLIPYSYNFFYDAFTIGDSTVDYEIPTWPSKLLVPIAFSIWFVRLAIEFFGFLRLVINPDLEPVGVPIIKSAADVAKEEMTETFGRDSGVGIDSESEAGR